MTTSGAPDSSRRQPEATHGCFRDFELVSQQHQKLPKSLKYHISISCAEANDGYITDEKTVHQKLAARQADDITIFEL